MKDVPVFIKIDEYKNVMDVMQVLKKKVKDAKGTIAEIRELKEKEDNELYEWAAKISEIEKKAEFIDRILFAPAEK